MAFKAGEVNGSNEVNGILWELLDAFSKGVTAGDTNGVNITSGRTC